MKICLGMLTVPDCQMFSYLWTCCTIQNAIAIFFTLPKENDYLF